MPRVWLTNRLGGPPPIVCLNPNYLCIMLTDGLFSIGVMVDRDEGDAQQRFILYAG